MPSFLLSLLLFSGYTLAIILLTGPSISWNETRRSFYMGSNRTGLWGSLGSFCSAWLSTITLVAYTVWLYRDGYAAFMGTVNGWMLAVCLMPFLVRRLRASRALSFSEWLSSTYNDWRLRPLSGVVILLTSLFVLVVQFHGVGAVIGYVLGISSGMAVIVLLSLFVLYTTLGGYVSVIRSGALNLLFVLIGVTVPAIYIIRNIGFLGTINGELFTVSPSLLQGGGGGAFIHTLIITLTWALSGSVHPQFCVRIMAARRRRDAYGMLSLAPFILGWIYVAVTLVGLGCRVLAPHFSPTEDLNYPVLLASALPYYATVLFLIAALAAAVSAASTQLLLAAGAFCYDLWPFLTRTVEDNRVLNPMEEEKFLFANRLSVAAILLIAMLMGGMKMPGMMLMVHYSWSMLAVCFAFPVLLPSFIPERGLFECLIACLLLHIALMAVFNLPPEFSLLWTLAAEYLLLFLCKRGWIKVERFIP